MRHCQDATAHHECTGVVGGFVVAEHRTAPVLRSKGLITFMKLEVSNLIAALSEIQALLI